MSESEKSDRRHAVLVTGAAGYIGHLVIRALARDPRGFDTIVAADIREPSESARLEGVVYRVADIRAPEVAPLVEAYGIDTVVHLAAVVTPRRGDTRQFQYEVDVEGTRNVLEASVAFGVRKFIYTSSGAAYGYSPDNRALLHEDDPLRGNEVFAYSWHKRLVEEMLAEYREKHPELTQLVFRVSTILGPTVNNQITAHFERRVVFGIDGVASPFCFISDTDVVNAILMGIHGDGAGIYNLTGDGVITLREIARAMGRSYVSIREDRLQKAFSTLHKVGVSQYGREQLLFLRYRPVLSNQRLKTEFGFIPGKSSREVFESYRRARTKDRSAEPEAPPTPTPTETPAIELDDLKPDDLHVPEPV